MGWDGMGWDGMGWDGEVKMSRKERSGGRTKDTGFLGSEGPKWKVIPLSSVLLTLTSAHEVVLVTATLVTEVL